MDAEQIFRAIKELGFPSALAVVLLYMKLKTDQKLAVLLALILAKLNLKDPEDKP